MKINKSFALAAAFLITSGQAFNVKHELGTLELKTPAKRVVALEYSFVDTLIALGVKPVGGTLGVQGRERGAPPYLLPLTAGVSVVGTRSQPSLEKIAALTPDLIIADNFMQANALPQIVKVAPTAVFKSRRGDLNDLSEQTLKIGQLVGREAVARRLLKEQDELIAKARKFANAKAPTFVAATPQAGSMAVYTPEGFPSSFLENLGRKNQIPARGAETQYDVSLEGLAALAPQTLVLFLSEGEKTVMDDWKKNPLWQKIPAVQRGRVYQFDRANWTLGRGPLAIRLMITDTINSRLLQDSAPTGEYKY